MPFSSSSQDYSMQGLESYAQKLVDINHEKEESLRSSLCIVVAGGGGHAISTLASTPRASSLLLEGAVTYDRRSYFTYVGLPSNTREFGPDAEKFRFNSLEAAKLASEEALKRAMTFRGHKLPMLNGCVGVGCASALVSSSSPNNVKGGGFIVATRSDGSQLSLNVTLASKADTISRTRTEEDVFVSHLILQCFDLIRENENRSKPQEDTTTDSGDTLSVEWEPSAIGHDVAGAAARKIISGAEPVVVLLPVYENGAPTSFRALKFPVLPNGSLVVPGSFNPPHVGHIGLAQAALQAAERMGHSRRHDEKPIFMELSLANADKAPIDPDAVAKRVNAFLELETLPKQWGILLTSAPLFSQKVETLQHCVLDKVDGSDSNLSFVIGTDTLVRIVNPKYYNDDREQMFDALRGMEGVHFFAGGRLEQKKDSSGPPQFVSGKEELEELPQDVKEKFTIIEEEEFRVDISSTELRKKKEEAM